MHIGVERRTTIGILVYGSYNDQRTANRDIISDTALARCTIRITHFIFFLYCNILYGFRQTTCRPIHNTSFFIRVLASPTHTVFLKGKHTFSKLYYYVFVAFMILVSLNILFGRADWEGYGLLQFNNIIESPITNPIQSYNHVHNQFLDVWMKDGIGGLIFFVSILGLPFVIGIKLFIRNIAPEAALTLVFIGGSLFTFGVTEVYFEKPSMTILFAAYIPILLRFVEDVALKNVN